MVSKQYKDTLKQMVHDLIDEIIDDAIGIAAWKERRCKVCPTTPINQYGTDDFPSDSDSPLSTFSSTPNTTPSSATSPVTPSFEKLAGTQLMDNKAEVVKSNLEATSKDDKLVKYLIGEISDSEGEKHCTKAVACVNTDEKVNINPQTNLHETNLHEISLHETNTVAIPMVPVDANVIIKTANGGGNNDVLNKNKIKMKVEVIITLQSNKRFVNSILRRTKI